MTDGTVAAAPRHRRWPRILGLIIGILIILLIVFYFVATSSAFFKGVILPRVGRSMNAKITVADASIHPFSRVDLTHLRVETTGPEPLVTADEVRVVYHLSDILRGNYVVEELTLASPTVQIIKNPDGTSNLDPITKASNNQPSTAKPTSAQPKKSTPARIDIKKMTLSNGTVRMVETKADGEHDTTELTNAHLELENLQNGQTGKLAFGSDLKMDNRVPTPGTNSLLQGKATGAFNLTPGADLKSAAVNGNAHFDVQTATGALSDVAGLTVNLDSDMTPTEIKQLALRFQKGGDNLGTVHASGPFDISKQEGHIAMEIAGIDRRVLDLIGARSGIEFGTTTINSTNRIDLANQGSNVSVVGQLTCANLVINRAGVATPTVDVRADYDVNENRADNSTLLRTLTLDGTQNHQPLLHAELTKPMTLAKSGAANAVGDAAFKVNLTRLNLADWKSVISTPLSNGVVNATANVLSQQGGQKLGLDFNSTIDDTQGQRILGASGSAQYALDSRKADIRQFRLDLPPTPRATNQLTLSGQVDMSQTNALQGNLKLTSDSFDVTSLYDQLGNKPKPKAGAEPQPRPTTAPSPAPAANVEPAAMHLPVRSLVVDANIGRFYLREVAITNWQTTVNIDDSRVTVKPCQLTLNGAPVSATVALNLGVPGYQYDITFSADKVPLAPLANSFSEAYAGKAQGDLIANAQIKGAGVTGGSLQKSLAGDATLTFTNANIQLTGPKTKTLVTVLATALRLPELEGSPINWLTANLKLGNGAIQVTQFKAVSPMFTASTAGTIAIANVLTNSTINNLPVDIALPVALAKKARLAPPDLATNASFVDLGAIYHVGGTIGDPQPKPDKTAIAMLTARALPIGGEAGKIIHGLTGPGGTNSTGGGVGNLLQGLGGALGGKGSANTNPPGTNQPPKSSPFDFLRPK